MAGGLRTGDAYRANHRDSPVVFDAAYDQDAPDQSAHRTRCTETFPGVADPGDGDRRLRRDVCRLYLHCVDHDRTSRTGSSVDVAGADGLRDWFDRRHLAWWTPFG